MSAHLYISYSDMEAQINMRCCIMAGWDEEIVATIQPVLSQGNPFVEMFLQTREFLRKQEVVTSPGSLFVNPQSPNRVKCGRHFT